MLSKTRTGVAVLAAALLTAATACDTGEGTASPSGVKVGLVLTNQQAAFFNQLAEGARQAASTNGLDLDVFNANNDPSAQAAAIENYVVQGYAAVVVNAIDVNGIKPAVQHAHQAGVHVIAVDSIVQDPAVDVQVGTDNAQAAAEG